MAITPLKTDLPSADWQVEEEPDSSAAGGQADHERAANLLALALKALSQRAVAAITNLFTLVTMAGTWFLWWKTPDPNPAQIVSLSIFAAFVLAANWLVRRK
jgi:hypothetical protein